LYRASSACKAERLEIVADLRFVSRVLRLQSIGDGKTVAVICCHFHTTPGAWPLLLRAVVVALGGHRRTAVDNDTTANRI
jgi:hypothetical protein